MAQQILTGKWEDILQHSDELIGREVQVTVLDRTESPANDSAGPHNLAELLGDYIGAVEGKGVHNADQVSEVFAEGMMKKHQEGHL